MGRQFFQLLVIIMVQSGLVIVDEYRGGDVHGVGCVKKAAAVFLQ
jgi:hypothetical protein